MPSPFPGMNPYFERSTIWLDFHTEFLTSLRRLLVPQVTPKYFVQLDEHVIYAGTPEPPLSAEDDAWARQLIAAQRRT